MSGDNILICPVYNEEETLKNFYHQLRRYYFQDLLFVDDGSEDKSKQYLLGMKDKKTFLIRHPQRGGYGKALISGFRFALEKGYKKIITIDVDLQHNPRHIPLFLKGLSETEVILSSRYIKIGNCLDVPRERLLINKYIAGLLRVIFDYNFTDPFCGFRGYKDSFLKKVRLEEKSYGLGLEILLEIIRLNANFREIPIEAIYFNFKREFLNGLKDPVKRLLYYLEIISRKKKEIEDEKKKLFSCKSTS